MKEAYGKVESFIDLYIAAKRLNTKNQFLKPPKEGTKKYNLLVKAVEICEKIQANPVDFINWHIKRLSSIRVFPEPETLVNEKAINKYRVHQALKARYETPTYSRDGNEITIKPTFQSVKVSDFYVPMSKDGFSNYILYLIDTQLPKMSKEEAESALDKAYYTLAKADFLGKLEIINNIKELIGKLKEYIAHCERFNVSNS